MQSAHCRLVISIGIRGKAEATRFELAAAVQVEPRSGGHRNRLQPTCLRTSQTNESRDQIEVSGVRAQGQGQALRTQRQEQVSWEIHYAWD